MFQVWQAFHKGELRPIHMKKLATWEGIRNTFEPGSRPLWLSDHALRYCEAWGREAPGIIWVDHIAFGVELERRTGFRFFQGGGKDRHGKPIEKARADETIIASRGANSTGRNLQKWCRNLVTAMPANNRDFEQMVGRTHRDGQKRAVTVEILMGCKAHVDSLQKVLDDAARQDQTLLRQKATNFHWQHVREYPEGIQFNDHV
jgi:hypothetical protein